MTTSKPANRHSKADSGWRAHHRGNGLGNGRCGRAHQLGTQPQVNGYTSFPLMPVFSVLDPSHLMTLPAEQTVYGFEDMFCHT